MNEPRRVSRGYRWIALLARLQPWYLLTRYRNRWTRSLFAFLNGCIAISIMTGAAICTGQPLIFPSLGPTAFLCFYTPSAPAAAPRSVVLAHASGVTLGWIALAIFEHWAGPGSVATQIGAVALSMGLISAWMILANIPHPPAASTTLMVSLGLIRGWPQLAALLIAVILLTAQAYAINRLFGVFYPLWRPAPAPSTADGLIARALATEDMIGGGEPAWLPDEEESEETDPYAAIAADLAARKPVGAP